MKKTYLLIIPLLILFGIMVEGLGLYPSAQQPLEERSTTIRTSDSLPLFVPGEILVRFRLDATMDQIYAMNEAQGMTILEMNQGLGIYRLRVSRSVKEALAFAQSQPFVEDARPNYILAEVAGEIITLLDMESVIQQVPTPLRQIYTTAKAKETLLRTLVNNKVFSKAAKEENLDESPEVKRKIETAIEWTLAQEFQRKVSKHMSISEKELRNYYDDHIRTFQTPEQIKIRQIVVETEVEAREILEALEAGAEFEKIARERSIGATAQSGGELGWFGRGRLDPGLERTGFTLKKGETSRIIKTLSSYHLIKLEDKRSARQRSFSEVRNRIKQTLQDRKQKENTKKKRKELEERYKTRLYTESLSEIKVHTTGETRQADLIRSFQQILEKPY